MARKTKAPAASRTRKKKATKKGAQTWPVSPVSAAYLKTVKAQLEMQWQEAVSLVTAEKTGVPRGVDVILGPDGLLHPVIINEEPTTERTE